MVERHEKGSSIMNAKALIGTVIETIIKVLVLAAAIIRYTQPETWATCISVFEPLFKSDKTKQTVTKLWV